MEINTAIEKDDVKETIILNTELANLAYEMGLNIKKTCENALKEAIRRLQGSELQFDCVRNAEVAGSNPAWSPI